MKEISVSSIVYQINNLNDELDLIMDQINDIEGVSCADYKRPAPL